MKEWSLYDDSGKRKYITSDERSKFKESVEEHLEQGQKTFALMLYWSGCRIQEALNLEYQSIDYSRKGVVFRTLKRRKTVHRFVPLPEEYLRMLNDIHRLKRMQKDTPKDIIWSFDRKTGWRYIKKAMLEAKIEGVHATPKGLRHAFTIAHLKSGTPQHIIKGWTGWASDAMFEVYGKVVGEDERDFASALWNQ